MDRTGADSKAGKHLAALALAPIALAVAAYANALQAGFTWDDPGVIQHNPCVTGGFDVVRIFASPLFPGDLYRPITVLTFALNEQLAPGNAAAYHAVNVVLHAAVTLLVWRLAGRLFGSTRVALTAAALFAVHPIHTEAVTGLVGRAELLAALFGLGSMLCLVRTDAAGRRLPRISGYSFSLLLFLLALFSKESAVVYALLVPWCRIACRREALWAGLVREARSLDWVPYALGVVVFVLFRSWVLGWVTLDTISPLDNALAFVPWDVRMRSALGVLWDYFALLNVPLVLSADYSYDQVPIVTAWVAPRFIAGAMLLLVGVWVVWRDRRPAVTFATALPFVALALTSNVLLPIGTIKGERLLYFPSVGWTLLLAYGLDRLRAVRRYRSVGTGLVVILTLAFAARTRSRNWDWLNNTTLYRSLARTAPRSAKSQYNWGVILQDQGNQAEAMVQFRRALDIYHWSGGAKAALGIGIIIETQGQLEGALQWYQRALEIEPGLADAHTHLCGAFYALKRFQEAALACRRGLRYDPADTNLLKGLGESLISAGEVEKGVAVLHRSLALNSQDNALRARLAQWEPQGEK